eukprot:TRINITY_DN12598_c0_g1_i1.p1 TRINITY_DN12598_c0_g1~~TRINITY_DN12598_c0_g1_i1.p1  ORF type:complete len:397 (-),score=71.83 TRINITY_DN12598_c0_g1_i1:62-1252(-)
MEDSLVCMESEEEGDVVLGSLPSDSSALFRWETIFGENMLIVHQDRRDWLVGVQVAVLLNRETYNLYRSMKNKGINMERASIQQIDQLLAQGLVKPGTRSITLIPLDQARSFILEDQQRVEKRKQTKQTSKKPYEVMRTKLVQNSTHSLSSQWKLSSESNNNVLNNNNVPINIKMNQKCPSVSPTTSTPCQSELPTLPPPSLPQQVSFGVAHKEKKGEIRRPIPIHPTSPNINGMNYTNNNSSSSSSLRSAFHVPSNNVGLNQPNPTSSASSWQQIGRNPTSNSVWNTHPNSVTPSQDHFKKIPHNLQPSAPSYSHSQLPPIGDMLPDLFSSKDVRMTNVPYPNQPNKHHISSLKISSMLCPPFGDHNTLSPSQQFVSLPANSAKPNAVWMKSSLF